MTLKISKPGKPLSKVGKKSSLVLFTEEIKMREVHYDFTIFTCPACRSTSHDKSCMVLFLKVVTQKSDGIRFLILPKVQHNYDPRLKNINNCANKMTLKCLKKFENVQKLKKYVGKQSILSEN